MLSAFDISKMQDTFSGNMPDTCAIYRDSSVSDGMGGQTLTEALQATVGCYRAPLRNAQRNFYAERIGERLAQCVVMASGTDVQSGDRLSIGGGSWRVLGLSQISYDLAVEAVTALEE